MARMIRMLAIAAALLHMAATPALAQTTPAQTAPAQHLLILAKDGAFGGNLWSLAGLPLALDRADARVARVLTGLTDAHGWNPTDRGRWQHMDLSTAAEAVQAGRVAALALIADPADPALADALGAGRFRVIDLGDGVSRTYADTSGLATAWFDRSAVAGLSLGATTLVVNAPVQVAGRAD